MNLFHNTQIFIFSENQSPIPSKFKDESIETSILGVCAKWANTFGPHILGSSQRN